MNGNQLATGVITLLVTSSVCTLAVLKRGAPRKWTYPILWICAVLSIAAWTNFGNFQEIHVDADRADSSAIRVKLKQHRPFHFHDFVHYYMGPKYFRELGYLGLYDCITLADQEVARETHGPRRISGWVRNLNDVLTDKSYEGAVQSCQTEQRPHFTDERWAQFKNDIRELSRLADDGVWQGFVYDAGFNPPPSPILLTSTLANLIPVSTATGAPTYLLLSCLDLVLLLGACVAFRFAFGRTAALVVIVCFGASFLSHYTWNGGSVLRFSWFVEVVFGLAALKRGRFILAGVFLGLATSDRIFPGAFAAFAMIPLAMRARTSLEHRVQLKKYVAGLAGTILTLFIISALVFGWSAWATFFTRIVHHGDVYYVMHVGLKKVLTYRQWTHSQNFQGHDGLVRFKNWNLHLQATWRDLKFLIIPFQLLVTAGVAWASAKRRPEEAALFGGVACMFMFLIPANYYYCVLTLIPAFLFRAAATSREMAAKYRGLGAFVAFIVFWSFTIVAHLVSPDQITHNFYICAAFLAFLFVWIAAWGDVSVLREVRAMIQARSLNPTPAAVTATGPSVAKTVVEEEGDEEKPPTSSGPKSKNEKRRSKKSKSAKPA